MGASDEGWKRSAEGAAHGPGYGVPTALSWLALAWERLWPRLWPVAAVVFLFAAIVLLDILPLLPGWLHVAVLAALALAFCLALFRGFRRLRLPGAMAARRRLERTSGLAHRPLTAARDRITVGAGDAFAEALWRRHRARALKALERLRVGPPRPRVARRDPFALRGLAVILLALGVTVGWQDAPDRLARAFLPDFESGVAEPVAVEAWFTPPDYTGGQPRMVTLAHDGKPIVVPAQSKLLLQYRGGKGRPVLTLGRQRFGLQALDRSGWQGEMLLAESGDLVVRQRARNAVQWKISVTPDLPPTVAWAEDPTVTRRQNVRLDYKAEDDHGVRKVRVHIARAGETDTISIEAPVAGGKTAAGRVYRDMTPHRWAGLDVSMMFETEDDLGQSGRSGFRDMTLPERIFRHPVARAIIAQRKILTVEPEKLDRVVRVLGHIADNRGAFDSDPVVYLALRVAQGRLILGARHNGRDDTSIRRNRAAAIRAVQPILWETALRVDKGETAVSERELARIQDKLMELLSRRDIKDEELRRLLEELRRSMQEYMDALRREMERDPGRFDRRFDRRFSREPDRRLTERDIRRMLERMRDMLRNGDKDALRRMLSQLREMMQNLRQGRQQADRNNPARRMMRELDGLIRRQQQLMDESFRRGQQRRDGSEREREADRDAARRQGELRKRLGDLMRRLGEMAGRVPENFGRAEREMRRAERELGQGQPGRSVGPQGRALRELSRGMNRAMRQMARRFGMGPAEGNRYRGDRNRRFGPDRDPLGRRQDGMGPLDRNDVKVPTEAERKQARDILRELRRRSGETGRPKLERDYIERLLKRF
ncbi:MAG: DUF4175 family protein [Rhodospirillaceae bacterium]|nr:DUF4175 family protein [Rhodospirillaceae bacterium]